MRKMIIEKRCLRRKRRTFGRPHLCSCFLAFFFLGPPLEELLITSFPDSLALASSLDLALRFVALGSPVVLDAALDASLEAVVDDIFFINVVGVFQLRMY